MMEAISWGAVVLFALATVVTLREAYGPVERATTLTWWLTALGGLVLGFVYVNHVLVGPGLLEVSLGPSLQLMVLVTAGLFLLGGRHSVRMNRSVGMVLLPVLVVLLIIAQVLPEGQGHVRKMADPLLVGHLLCSVASYGLLSLATVLALLDGVQERALRSKSQVTFLGQLPSLDRLEEKLFFTIKWGFALLTLSMITGGVFSYQVKGVYFAFSHKVIFMWATWLVFGVLLLGHHFQGWRGRRAVRYILIGYVFLWLGYFGVKMVSELFLQR
ncbi:MAG: cytochrome c biogenesis protein CcsA [Magnetococcales bacterium]|nr:cytochrome c biogenesis protein CcsA [Magnetococcales bacterium]